MKIENLVIATHNPSKKSRYTTFFSKFVPHVFSLSDFGVREKVEETGSTAEENAQLKALFYMNKTGLPVFGEDESLFVDFLGHDQQPGVHIRRINGKDDATDDELISYWEKMLIDVEEDKRFGRWHTAFALAIPGKPVRIESIEYPIKFFSPTSRIRLAGWPMSSLEGPVRFNKPHAELTAEELSLFDHESDETVQKMLALLFQD